MRHLCSIFLLLCWINIINAQQVTFSKVFSNFPLTAENGWVLNEVNNGFLLLSPASCMDNPIYWCTSISKIDNEGAIIWSKIYPFKATVSNMVVYNNKIYASGHTNGSGSQFVLYCIDSLGNVLWDKQYGNPSVENEFPRLALWGDNLVLCGAQDRNINNRPAPIMYFVVTDLDGNQLNEFFYGEDNESTLSQKLEADNQGNLMVGFKYCPDTCFLDLKSGVVSLDTLENFNWEVDLPFSYDCWSCVPSQVSDSIFAISWCIDNLNIPNHDLTPPAIFFTDMAGNILDTVVFQNQTLKEVRNMEPVWERGLIGCGHEYPGYINQSSPQLFGWLFRMDENREVLWERSYLDTTYQGRAFGLQHIIPTSDGGYLATGTITNYMTGVWESHNWLLKLDSMGCLEPGCGNINYITDTEDVVFLKGKDIKTYPNPASDYVQVEFPKDFLIKDVTLRLLSNDGKLVKQTSVISDIQTLSLSGLLSGMYYIIIIRSNEIIASKRAIVHH